MEDKCCNVNVNETITNLRYDDVKKGLVYRNEGYHLQGDPETFIKTEDIANDINLEDLANVNDKVSKGCGILAHRSSCQDCANDCPDCPQTNCEHEWYNWRAEENVGKMPIKYLAGFNDAGCLVAIPAPTDGISMIVGKNGKWTLDTKQLPPGVDPNAVFPAIGNRNFYGVNSDMRTPDKSIFIATHPINEDWNGDEASTSKTPGA